MPNRVAAVRRLQPGQQPQYPVKIDYTHPLAKPFAAFVISARHMANLVGSNNSLSFSSSAITRDGPMMALDTNTMLITSGQPAIAASGDYSWCFKGAINSSPNDGNVLMGNRNGGATGFVKLQSDGQFRFYVGGSDPNLATYNYNANTGTVKTVIVTKRGDNVYSFVDGLQVASAGSVTWAMGANPYALGGDPNGSTEPTAPGFYHFWHGPFSLTDAEVLSLSLDPYQVLKPSVPLGVTVPTGAALPLDLSRVSYMNFQRHYSPIAIGT